ncbi:hypothetical protein RJT34_30858 [Clitoria ternatea]|uniref:Uncharacterized protein n=1 Tax=Clitoria ternatea TaxID=43366 RepID=A0AAN9ETX7_CLITE
MIPKRKKGNLVGEQGNTPEKTNGIAKEEKESYRRREQPRRRWLGGCYRWLGSCCRWQQAVAGGSRSRKSRRRSRKHHRRSLEVREGGSKLLHLAASCCSWQHITEESPKIREGSPEVAGGQPAMGVILGEWVSRQVKGDEEEEKRRIERRRIERSRKKNIRNVT